MKTDLPECFSPRERLFLVKSMVKDFKEIFTAMEELMGYQFNINVSGDIPSISFLFVVCQMFPQPWWFSVCSIWSSELLLSDGDNDSSGSRQLQGLPSLSWLLAVVHFTTIILTHPRQFLRGWELRPEHRKINKILCSDFTKWNEIIVMVCY